MEALRGDRTIQAIAAKHEVHPNQVSGWKRQAQAGLQELFAGASKRRQKDHDRRDDAAEQVEGLHQFDPVAQPLQLRAAQDAVKTSQSSARPIRSARDA